MNRITKKRMHYNDRYRMNIQRHFYDFYISTLVRFKARWMYLDRIAGDTIYQDELLFEGRRIYLNECDRLDQERSI